MPEHCSRVSGVRPPRGAAIGAGLHAGQVLVDPLVGVGQAWVNQPARPEPVPPNQVHLRGQGGCAPRYTQDTSRWLGTGLVVTRADPSDDAVGWGKLAAMSPAAHITVTVALIVIGAGVLHASWNAIVKDIDDLLLAFGLVGVVMTLGGGIGLVVTGLPFRNAIPFVLGSVVIHVAYQLGLMRSYRLGAFNQTYPIARGTSPLVVAVGGYFLASEHLGPGPLTGVIVLAVGLMSLAFSSGRLSRADFPAVAAAVLTGLTIAGYTLVDGLGVRRAHDPFAYTYLLFLVQGPVFPALVLGRRPLAVWRDLSTVARGLSAGLLALVAYGAVLWAQTRAPLAEVAALRETSVISAAVIGVLCFKERFGSRRLVAALLVAAGIALIAF